MMGKIKAMFQTTSYCFSSNIKSPANSKKTTEDVAFDAQFMQPVLDTNRDP
jgi:hypothetical protein